MIKAIIITLIVIAVVAVIVWATAHGGSKTSCIGGDRCSKQ